MKEKSGVWDEKDVANIEQQLKELGGGAALQAIDRLFFPLSGKAAGADKLKDAVRLLAEKTKGKAKLIDPNFEAQLKAQVKRSVERAKGSA